MTRQWRKEKQSDLAKPGFSLAYAHYLTLNFHTLCKGGVLLSGVRTSENQITPGAPQRTLFDGVLSYINVPPSNLGFQIKKDVRTPDRSTPPLQSV